MKKLILSLPLASLVLASNAAGQHNGDRASSMSKSRTILGKVTEDGKSLIAVNGESWFATNPNALAGREGRHVKVKCQISSGTHDIHVLVVKMVAPETKYAVNLGDAAFRR